MSEAVQPWKAPSSWLWATVADVGNVSLGRQRSPPNHTGPNMRPYVRAANITWAGLDLSDVKSMNFDEADFVRFVLCPGDVLLNEGSGSAREVGKAAIWQGEINQCCFQNTLLRVKPCGCTSEYLHRYFQFCALTGRFVPETQGVNIIHIGKEGLARFPIPVPPLAEQRRIVAKLDALTARTARARTDLDRVPALAEKCRRAVLSAEFLAISEASAETKTVEQVALQIFDGPFGSHLKSADYTDAGVRVIRLENIGHLKFNGDKRTYVSDEKYASLVRHSLEANDVLFSSFVDEEIRVCLLPSLEQAAINKADCFCVRVDPARCDPRFLAYRLACHSTYEIFSAQVHGATRPRVNLGQLKAFPFVLPSLVEQEKIIRRIDHAFAEIDRLVAEAAAARRLLDRLDQAILAKAFRGELVPQDPADEPVSVLLDRIRTERAAAPVKVRRGRRVATG